MSLNITVARIRSGSDADGNASAFRAVTAPISLRVMVGDSSGSPRATVRTP